MHSTLLPPVRNRPDYASALDRIGRDLCSSAIRHGGLATWTGRSASEVRPGGEIVPTVGAVGTTIYEGTAGIALFLGYLYSVSGEQQYKTLALEAVGHALAYSTKTESSFGFYTGRAGIAYSAGHLGELLSVQSLVASAVDCFRSMCAEAPEDQCVDVVGGLAGAIVGGLSCPPQVRSGIDIGLLEKFGDALVSRAVEVDGTWSWPDLDATQPLTGLAHGASGMAIALLELYSVSSKSKYLEVARGAFGYERLCFDEEQMNWPDFRGREPSTVKKFGNAWCHGAPGIALARRRAIELSSDEGLHRDWDRALEGCLRRVQRAPGHRVDLTPCHGLAGGLEPLVCFLSCDPNQAELSFAMVDDIWRPYLEAGLENRRSGLASGGPNPSLMLGDAGIGWALLRAYTRGRVPSVLMPLLA